MENPILPVVDVVVPTRNRPDLIGLALHSLRACTGVKLKIWIIDQSDSDATAVIVASQAAVDQRVQHVPSSLRGISASRNLGIELSMAPFILFTDDDCRVEPGWAAALAAALADEQIAMAFGRILAEHSDEPTVGVVTRGLSLATKTSLKPAIYQGNRFNLSFGHGASMGIRREVWERLGGFDEALGVGGPLRSWEDRDFGYRILLAGGRIAYVPEAVLYHRQWRDWQAVWHAYRDYGFGVGAAAGKYLRSGDPGGLVLLFEWITSQGLRQVLSGLLKWQSWQKTIIGLQQLVFPWYGLAMGLRYSIDRKHGVYSYAAAARKEVALAQLSKRSD
jgi:GT2 family glycosyltransferase